MRLFVVLAFVTITNVDSNPLFGSQNPSNDKSSSSGGFLGLGNFPSSESDKGSSESRGSKKSDDGSSKGKKSSEELSDSGEESSDSIEESSESGLFSSLMKAASPKKNAPSKGYKKKGRSKSKSKGSSKSKSKGSSKSRSKESESGGDDGLLGGLIGGLSSPKKSTPFGFLMRSSSHEPSRSEDGFKIDEGDIAISDGDFLRKTIRLIELWRDGVVFYTFDKSVNDTMKDLFNLAMKEWEDYTCLKFREKQSLDQVFYAKYRTDKDGCYSFVGRQTKDIFLGQDVNLGDGCDSLHTAIHEIGHMLGLSHEQSRSDRDDYIRINFENIEKSLYSQFEKQKTRNEEAEYDYKSVMQYPSWGFSVDPFEKITMSSVNPLLQYLLDEERQGLSFKDIKVINRIYGCSSRCKEKIECQNGGAFIPYKSKDKSDCACICPNGYEGEQCEYQVKSSDDLPYYGGLRCGGNVTSETTINTPTRSLSIPGCSWWIQAPQGQKIVVEFIEFDFRPKESYGTIDDKCIFEKVEIRAANIYDPQIHCGTDLKGKTITSEGSNFIIVVVGDLRGEEKLVGNGLEARITFEDGGVDVPASGQQDSGHLLVPGLL